MHDLRMPATKLIALWYRGSEVHLNLLRATKFVLRMVSLRIHDPREMDGSRSRS
jgi:hypothetical protein